MRILAGAFLLLQTAAGGEPGVKGVATEGATAVQTLHVLRLRPGTDLVQAIRQYAAERGIRAAAVTTVVGSLRQVRLRYANRPEYTTLNGKFEIVSMTGTLDPAGGHLHLAVSDGRGRTVGGHVDSGCLVYTTAEIVLAELGGLEFAREPDPDSGYRELVVKRREGGR